MEITLQRTKFTENSTEGDISIGGIFECVSLELPVKDGLPGSCIPPGRYQVVLVPSPKFEATVDPWVLTYAKNIPHLLGIPNRTNILIHWGNSAINTEGCILVGTTAMHDYISESRLAFAALWQKLMRPQMAGEEIWITVQGGTPLKPLADLSMQGDV